MKKDAKVAAMNKRVQELESELQAAKTRSVGLRSQVADLQKEVEDKRVRKEEWRRNREAETTRK
jgi:predicted  nucleic acid-binding Zn-ribbon protein